MILYTYFRSSASYRVRLGLAMKGLAAELRPVNLRDGEQRAADYLALNPQGLVPALVLENGTVLSQSLAILEYLEEAHPAAPRLLPVAPEARARVRAIAQYIGCEMQPLNNLRTLRYVQEISEEAQKDQWLHHWLDEGFRTLEPLLPEAGFVGGSAPGLAECFLIPQAMSALRFHHDLTPYPRLRRIHEATIARPELAPAHPQAQPDFVAG